MTKTFTTPFLVCFLLLSVLGGTVFSQPLNYTLNRDYLYGIDRHYNAKDQNFQTFVKPYRYSDINKIQDSTAVFPTFNSHSKKKKNETKLSSGLDITPLMNAQAGYQAGSPSRFTNDLAIGANVSGNIADKFAFNFKALAGKVVFNSAIDSFIKQTRIIPGIGYAYGSKDSLNKQYAYEYFSGYLSWSPTKLVNVQIGRDKHFWGDGYRSLFLSDVAAPYPYFKITTSIWHLTYVNLFTIMKDASHATGLKKDELNKYATFHYLGWNVTKRLNIGLFESIVWQGSDSSRYRGYDVNYLNPVLFFRPTEYSLGSSDNAFIGVSFKVKILKRQQLYGQLLLDEFLLKEILSRNGWWGNKYAFQLGFKSFDVFRLKRLNFQTELNYVRPYTYSHGSVQQNYAHFNQPLGHPLGANFMESASFLNYRYRRLFIEAKLTYAVYGADSAGTDYGKNIFISYTNRQNEYGNAVGQGLNTNLITASLRTAYIIDSQINLKIELGIAYRIQQNKYNSNNLPYFFIGIHTDLCNLYDDF